MKRTAGINGQAIGGRSRSGKHAPQHTRPNYHLCILSPPVGS